MPVLQCCPGKASVPGLGSPGTVCSIWLWQPWWSIFSYFPIPPPRLYLKFTLLWALLILWHFYQALEFSSWEPHPLPFVTLSFQLISTRGCLEPLENYMPPSSLNKILSSHPSGDFSCQQNNSDLNGRILFITRSPGAEGVHVSLVLSTSAPSSVSLLAPPASHCFSFWSPQDWKMTAVVTGIIFWLKKGEKETRFLPVFVAIVA